MARCNHAGGQEEHTSHFWWESSRRDTRLQASQQPSLRGVLQEHHIRSWLLVEVDISYTGGLSLSVPALSLALSSCLSPHLASLPAASTAHCLHFPKNRVGTVYTDCRRAVLGHPQVQIIHTIRLQASAQAQPAAP